jgi:predicted RNA methylase
MTFLYIIFAVLIIMFGFTAFFGAPYVPSIKSEVEKAFKELCPLTKKDLLIDLGAGDGIVQKIASKYDVKSIGIELNPVIALVAKIRLRKIKNAKIICKNFFKYEFPKETTVIYVFGDSRDLTRIFDKIQKEARRLKKPLKVISYGFDTNEHKLLKKVGAYFLYEVR